jgi:signal transduction histidine kinase
LTEPDATKVAPAPRRREGRFDLDLEVDADARAPGYVACMRPPRADLILAVALAAAGALEVRFNHGVEPKWAGLVTEVPFPLALAWRRRAPIAVAFAIAVEMALEPVLGVPLDQPVTPMAVLLIAFYSLGSYEPLGRSLAAFVGVLPLGILAQTQRHSGTAVKAGNVLFGLALAGGAWIAGILIRARTRQVAVAEAEAVRAVAEERARIARELHDVIAHSVSVMVVQAGAAEEVLRTAPERALAPVRAIQETGREALVEMSRLVGLLRDHASELGLAPQPGLADLGMLIEQVRDAGLPVDVQVEGQPRHVPLGVDLSAYRVVQEALTNALKHAGEARATVRLRYRPDSLELEVLDDGPGTANGHVGGHGLVGMRERIAVFGGEFDAGPREDGGFRVRAVLPA